MLLRPCDLQAIVIWIIRANLKKSMLVNLPASYFWQLTVLETPQLDWQGVVHFKFKTLKYLTI